jgi:hypothetical protein
VFALRKIGFVFEIWKMAPTSSFPIIDMGLLAGEERPAAMDLLRDACENWGFFQVGRHKNLTKTHNKISNREISLTQEHTINLLVDRCTINVLCFLSAILLCFF